MDVECEIVMGVAFDCDEIVPVVQSEIPKWGKMFEQFFGVLHRFALLSDHLVVFLCA
jgi:hypothetical protein